jgi:hypothetical protein
MEAVQISATPEAEAALREPLMKQAPAVILQGPIVTVTQTTFSPDGRFFCRVRGRLGCI